MGSGVGVALAVADGAALDGVVLGGALLGRPLGEALGCAFD
jgi:hypothetical protein